MFSVERSLLEGKNRHRMDMVVCTGSKLADDLEGFTGCSNERCLLNILRAYGYTAQVLI